MVSNDNGLPRTKSWTSAEVLPQTACAILLRRTRGHVRSVTGYSLHPYPERRTSPHGRVAIWDEAGPFGHLEIRAVAV